MKQKLKGWETKRIEKINKEARKKVKHEAKMSEMRKLQGDDEAQSERPSQTAL